MKVYLKNKNSIAEFKEKADGDFWDRHWRVDDLKDYITSCRNNDFIIQPLRKYLPDEQGLILEGGCGRAQNVYCMKYNGYNAVGVDFAGETVNAVNRILPELDVRLCDVRNLPFKDGEIAGYWSLGVIEHFWHGYTGILDEMARVIRREKGYLFLTFPHMSPLRRIKALLNLYPSNYTDTDIESFYQYCLDHIQVLNDLGERGFILREKIPFDGIKGFKDEVCLLRTYFQKVYDGRKLNTRIGRRIAGLLDKAFKPVASHGVLLIMEKFQ